MVVLRIFLRECQSLGGQGSAQLLDRIRSNAVELAQIARTDDGELFEARIASPGQRAQGRFSQFGREAMHVLLICLL